MKAADTEVRTILQEAAHTLEQISEPALEQLSDLILGSGRLFVAGAGRSGLMMRAFAMRLAHLGLPAYVVGETVTPALQAGDLLIIGSGSGETKSLVSMADKAKGLGSSLALATIAPDSSLGLMADLTLHVPASVKDTASSASIQPMGSLFEQCLLLLLDAVVMKLMHKQGIDTASMYSRHANLE